MVALDCEMCQTCEGNEVTRLTLVDEQRAVLLDAFIKPYNPITDYHTRYSGITPEIMATCTTRLEQVAGTHTHTHLFFSHMIHSTCRRGQSRSSGPGLVQLSTAMIPDRPVCLCVVQVQVALLRLIRADTILVGHSLEQDLMVVRLMHLRYVTPTATSPPHPTQVSTLDSLLP